MKSRAEIKREALSGFQGNYWPSVGIFLLGGLLVSGLSAIPAVGGLFALFVGSIITVGICGVAMGVYKKANIDVGQLFLPFSNYGHTLGGMLWMWLWLFLWSLIYIIPAVIMAVAGGLTSASLAIGYHNWSYFSYYMGSGILLLLAILSLGLLVFPIIKGCSYFCTPYILSMFPRVGAMDALKLSQKIMDGHKMDIFVAVLSFLGWFILSALTFGILWIFYVGPYYYATMAGHFDAFKNDAINKGVITAEELNGGFIAE